MYDAHPLSFTLQLQVAARCKRCGRLWDLTGLQLVDADSVLGVVVDIDGPCPSCVTPDGGDGGEVQAAE